MVGSRGAGVGCGRPGPTTASHRRRRSARRHAGRGDAVEQPRPSIEIELTRSRCDGAASAASQTIVSAPSRRRPQDRPHQPGEPGQRGGQARRVGPAGMHRGERHVAGGMRRAHSRIRHDLGALRPGVGPGARRTAPPSTGGRRGEGPGRTCPPEVTAIDAGPGGRTEERQEIADQGEGPDDHRRERRLDAVSAHGAVREDRAGVVDDDVEAGLGPEDLRGCGTDRRERAPCRRPRSGSGPRRGGRRARRVRPRAVRGCGRPGRSALRERPARRRSGRGPRSARSAGPSGRPGRPAPAASSRTGDAATAYPIRVKLPTTVDLEEVVDEGSSRSMPIAGKGRPIVSTFV